MSSRRRLYLNLKSSITKLFKTPAHYLKELTGKQSLFEKPYLDKDYRAMHLNLPVPSWKRPEFDPGGIWPPTGSRKLFVIFDEGICSVSSFGGDCGEAITISGWLALLPPAAYGTPVNWSATIISGEDLATIGEIETSLWGHSATINVQLSDTNSGTVVICVRASSGPMLKELRYDCPPLAIGGITKKLVEWTPSFEYARNNLVPYYQSYQTPEWDCGCVDLEVVCKCEGASWDSDASAETVGASSSCSVAIKDASGGNRTWTVSGTGAWLDAGFTKTSLTNQANSVTIYTDATACGSILVSVCGASGYVRCTVGQWGAWNVICQDPHYPGSCPPSNQCNEISGNRQNMTCRQCTVADTCTCVGTQLCDPPGSGWPPCDDLDCNYPDCFCSGGLQQDPDPGTWGVTISQYRFWECA